MTNIIVKAADIREFEAYEENDVVTVGFLLRDGLLLESMQFQIETEYSELRDEPLGMYAEFDERGYCGIVTT